MFNFLSLNFLLCKIDIIMTMSHGLRWINLIIFMKCRVQSKNSVLVAIIGGYYLHMLFYALHIILSLIFTWIICALYLNLFPISVILFSRKISLKTMTPRNVIFLSQKSRNYRQEKKIKTNYGLQTHLASYLFFYSLWNKSFSTISWKECTAWELCVKFDSSRGKMRTLALEAACPIALRNYSKKAAGEVSICVILVKGACMQSHTYFCKRFLLVTRGIHHRERI